MKLIKIIKEGINFITIASLILLFISACVATKSRHQKSFYVFEYQGKKYGIRSINNPRAGDNRNELVANGLLAVDYDQNRYIDEVIFGDLNLEQAQSIYQYGISKIEAENKLKVVTPDFISFQYRNTKYSYEIRSFVTSGDNTFNQFRLYKDDPLMSNPIIICNDHNADGKLDVVIEGNETLADLQSKYMDIIRLGMRNAKIIRTGNSYMVRQD